MPDLMFRVHSQWNERLQQTRVKLTDSVYCICCQKRPGRRRQWTKPSAAGRSGEKLVDNEPSRLIANAPAISIAIAPANLIAPPAVMVAIINIMNTEVVKLFYGKV